MSTAANRDRASDRWGLMGWARAGLIASVLLLAVAPLSVDPSYSILTLTLSQAGGQGVEGAWLQRTAVAIAAASVFAMTLTGSSIWSRWTARWLHLYSLALVLLIIFPTSPWDGSPYVETIAMLHTCSAILGGLAFIFAIVSVSLRRPRGALGNRIFDWVTVCSIAIIPQFMMVSETPGVLQRVMVAIGYCWLFFEASRMAGDLRSEPKASRVDRPDVRS